MTTYRAGQRVRIEFPDGSAAEGKLTPAASVGLILRLPDIAYVPDYTDDGRTVTVLSEPRPDEPQGLGAVVEDEYGGFWVRADQGERCWREVLPGTYIEDDASRRGWDHVSAVRVLSEGWKP